ncbi:MAG: Polyamine aminopropyltransferase [Steroidobacteraceae bacterium]|nr:Polyamine aminopropyltransferase [Steroidobacteraceae bacterium]
MSRTRGAVNARAPATRDTSSLAVLALCFALSGLAALVYQTAWTRQFALVFGTSELAVATVLAAYMAGLALGAALIERLLPRVARPVLTYAVLELGIGIASIVLVPLLLHASEALLRLLFGGEPAPPSSEHGGISFYFLASAFVVLAVPATLMGATLPLLARHAVREDREVGRRIGLLYAANTAGAVAGALLAAFWMLPALGLRSTIVAAAVVNAIVFLLAARVSRGAPSGRPFAATPRIPLAGDATKWILPLMLLSGAVTFLNEVLWARMLSHVVGSSIHAFGVMVASFLTGIALGGGIASSLATTRERATRLFIASEIGVALTAAAAFLVLDRYVPTHAAGLAHKVTFGFALLLPMTLFIGATYPFAVRMLATGPDTAAAASARVYAWNTVGAILGAVSGGFLLIPALRYEGAISAAVTASAAIAAAAAWLYARRRPWLPAAITALAVLGAVAFRPGAPLRLLLASPLDVPSDGTLLHYDVGRSADVVVLGQDGGLVLRTNGLPEAMMDTPGIAPRFSGEFWLSPLAVIARPDVERMLIVGYGGGMVVEGVPPSVAAVDVIELESAVLDANRATRQLRRRDPLLDPRVDIVVNDARGALALTDRRYDAIVSQPSHPWTAGASHLYTREFLRLAHAHLTPGGVFIQWMNVGFLDEALLRSLTATLLDVFAEVRIYRPDPSTLLFLASDAKLDPETQVATTGAPLDRSPLHYARFGIDTAEDLVAALVADAPGARALAAGAPLITDDRNRLATSNVLELGRGLSADATGRVLAPYDPLQRADSFVHRALAPRLSMSYIARRLTTYVGLDASLRDRIARLGAILGDTPRGAYVRALSAMTGGDTAAGLRLYHEARAHFPDDAELRFELVRPNLASLAHGTAPAGVVEVARGLRGEPALVLLAISHAAHERWDDLVQLDDDLAAIPWVRPWAIDALQVRIDWRTRVANPQARRAYGDEALALVDRALVVQPTSALFGLRTRAAITANRPEVIVESIAGYGQAMYATAARSADSSRRGRAIRTLQGLEGVLDETAKEAPPVAARAAVVRGQVLDWLRKLQQQHPTAP